jgi:hypothetical protein
MLLMQIEMRTSLGRGATVRGVTLGEVLDLGWAMILQWRKQSRKHSETTLTVMSKRLGWEVPLKTIKRKDFDQYLRDVFDFPRFIDGAFYIPERFR